eukprot:scaffold90498_cov61-Phaeocystis_antarctica.AAC.1
MAHRRKDLPVPAVVSPCEFVYPVLLKRGPTSYSHGNCGRQYADSDQVVEGVLGHCVAVVKRGAQNSRAEDGDSILWGEYLVNIARAGWPKGAAQVVLGHVLAKHVVVVEEVVRVSGRRSSGSFGSDRTAGYAIGEGRTSPWLEAITGIRERPYPRLGSKPVPAPRTRSDVRDMSPSDFHRRDRLKHPLPSARK